MATAYIVEAVRTAGGRRGGKLAGVHPVDLLAKSLDAIVERSGIDPKAIDDVVTGCVSQAGEQAMQVGRMGVLASKLLPQSTPAVTIDRQCGSSQQAIQFAAQAVMSGTQDVVIASGVESMTRVPMGGFNTLPNPKLLQDYPQAYVSMGITAENLAKKYGIDRKAQEQMAVESHAKAAAAQKAGKLKDEIVAIVDGNNRVELDGCIRPDTSAEGLAGLNPAFDAAGTVTAGTSSPLTDGASATLVCSEDFAKAHGLKVLARIKSVAVAGCAPELMGIGPVPATRKALERAGLKLDDIDIIELNEAFAAQALGCVAEAKYDMKKVNLDGGAIALGHPMGATGARITGKAASLLKREGKQFALATQCIGGGQGIATVLEAV